MGAASRVVAGCVISVNAGPQRLSFTKSYPSLGPIAEYLDQGTPRMAARPFFEFRAIDLEFIRNEMRAYIIPQGFIGRAVSFFRR
jgi:hypothetical protein